MADWEDEDWETSAENFKPAAAVPAPKAGAAEPATKGQAVLAAVTEVDMSKFADEDQEPPEEKDHNIVKSQPKKKEEKKWMKGDAVDDTPLDDPVAEKLRRQRLVEQADYAAAKDLFGGDVGGVNLDAFLPKSVKDFEDYASTLVNRYVAGHKDSKNFKVLVKALTKQACASLSATDIKEVESYVGVLRVEKTKAEQAAKVVKAPKKSLGGFGKSGLTAGLDEFQYDDAGDADDDFM